jgi:hypothetical protein
MTIFHRSILAGAALIGNTEDDPQMRVVLLEPSGEIVAINRWAVYVASPPAPEIVSKLPLKDDRLPSAVTISNAQISELVKAIPPDRQFKTLLEHVTITQGNGNLLDAAFNNGKGVQSVRMRSTQGSAALLNWRDRLKAVGPLISSSAPSFVYNRLRLKTVNQALEVSCKYSGEFDAVTQAIFKSGYIWRAQNGQTGQRIVIAWIAQMAQTPFDSWEINLFTKRGGPLERPLYVTKTKN